MSFKVIDTETGEVADIVQIALNEPWAKNLIYCDMDGWAMQEDGCLLLMDECGGIAFPPEGRYKAVRLEDGELPESDKDIALGQAVELATYVEEHAKGKMSEAARMFLSVPFAQKIAALLKKAKGEDHV